jgi:hypothetical protein
MVGNLDAAAVDKLVRQIKPQLDAIAKRSR